MIQGNTGIKNFFIKAATVFLILIATDQALGFLLRQIYSKQVAGDYSRATYTIDSVKTAALVFGSSRASHHYVPEVFEDELKKSFYNAGRDGCGLFYNYATFKSVIKRYSPQVIIFDFAPDELLYIKDDYDRLASLLPYYKNHPEIKDMVYLRGAFEKYKLYSASYPFNSQLVSLITGKLKLSNDDGLKRKGYLPLYKKMKSGTADNFLKGSLNAIDSNKVKVLNEIASTCRQKNIQLIFICSPIFSNAENNDVNRQINEVAKKYEINYWNFSTDTAFDNHRELFQDNGHLNDSGANLFSQIIAAKIVQLPKEKTYSKAN